MSGAFFIGFLPGFGATFTLSVQQKGQPKLPNYVICRTEDYSPESASSSTSGGISLNQALSLSESLSTPIFFRDENAST